MIWYLVLKRAGNGSDGGLVSAVPYFVLYRTPALTARRIWLYCRLSDDDFCLI